MKNSCPDVFQASFLVVPVKSRIFIPMSLHPQVLSFCTLSLPRYCKDWHSYFPAVGIRHFYFFKYFPLNLILQDSPEVQPIFTHSFSYSALILSLCSIFSLSDISIPKALFCQKTQLPIICKVFLQTISFSSMKSLMCPKNLLYTVDA